MKDKRVLITGGAGLIGSHIADLVVQEQPREIIILDNFVRGRHENLRQAMAAFPLTIIEGDIRNRALLACLFAGVDVVFHQAAIRITQCAEEPRLAFDVLAGGTLNLTYRERAEAGGKMMAEASLSLP